MNPTNMLDIENLEKHFPIKKGIFKGKSMNRAVDRVTFSVKNEQMFGLVGESGCGKSTLARLILRLMEPTSGKIYFDGTDITGLGQKALRPVRKKMQVVFQDPYSSLNPRMKVLDIVGRGLDIYNIVHSSARKKDMVVEWLEKVGLGAEFIERYIHEFSGGQLQRIAIARALCVHPLFVILDEPTSALDVSIQAQICNLLRDLKDSFSLTFLFISHNLAVVKHLSDRIGVMYLGRIVEMGPKEEIFSSPKHPYTEALLSATLDIESDPRERILLPGKVRSAMDLPKGCRFAPRCFRRMDVCERSEPALASNGSSHSVACFLYS
ncbi:MAG: ATP-binding cassette domain-containing protein [Deltaproteobacteria bacterium]|nr:ATP-binding cassette domain-containing protein [Deltaproteobacteria bacterium]